jgi:hypothetical protein
MPVKPGANLGVLVRGVVVEMAMALHAAADDLAFKDVERGKQGRSAMPLVIMRHGRAAALPDRQAGRVRSSAWICDFSSTDKTTACAVGST